VKIAKQEEHHLGRVWEITTDEDITQWLQSLLPGDQLVLHEGIYEGSLLIDISGVEGFPIVIRGYGNGEDRPVFLYEGSTAQGVQITGDHLILDFIEFRSTDTYCVRIGMKGKGAQDVSIQNSVFNQCGGGDVSANYYDVPYDNIKILDNYFIGSKRTSVYIGNHQGTTLVTNFLFKGNVIDGSQNDGPETTVGYGIELKLNVTKSIVENNFITGTKGPGIMVYGAASQDLYNSNIVRNNIVVNSRKEAGIVVGGGPSVIEDNIVVNSKWGIYVQDYGERDLLDQIVINRNTLVDNLEFGLSFQKHENIYASRNVVYTKSAVSGFVNAPGLLGDNKTVTMSRSMTETSKKFMNLMPAESNLRSIWRHSISGPLTFSQLQKVSEILSDNPISTKVHY